MTIFLIINSIAILLIACMLIVQNIVIRGLIEQMKKAEWTITELQRVVAKLWKQTR